MYHNAQAKKLHECNFNSCSWHKLSQQYKLVVWRAPLWWHLMILNSSHSRAPLGTSLDCNSFHEASLVSEVLYFFWITCVCFIITILILRMTNIMIVILPLSPSTKKDTFEQLCAYLYTSHDHVFVLAELMLLHKSDALVVIF